MFNFAGFIKGFASGKLNNFNIYTKEKVGLTADKLSSSMVVNEIYPQDANLEISLLDVEAEANLFVDESSTYTVDPEQSTPHHETNESIDIR